MSSTAVPQSEGNTIVRGNGAAARLAAKRASTQAAKPAVNFDLLEHIGRELLIAIGEDPEREGLRKTPNRFARMWKEFIEYDAGNIDTTFEAVSTDQMVVVSGMKTFSLCEHHLLPFWSEISIAYIASDHVLGLSKFARIAHKFSHRLQVQERLVDQIADEIMRITGSRDVGVLARGEHLCMQMRGVRTKELMTTSVMRGLFRSTDAHGISEPGARQTERQMTGSNGIDSQARRPAAKPLSSQQELIALLKKKFPGDDRERSTCNC